MRDDGGVPVERRRHRGAIALDGGETSAGPEPIPFVADRPFLLGIRDATTGALLFWGRIVEPS